MSMSERHQPAWLRWVLAFAVLVAVALLASAATLFLVSRDMSESTSPDAVDIGFSQDMSTHHLQAVEMANVARERSRDPLIRQLGFDIETGQLEQVGRMKGWLSMWNQPPIPAGTPMGWMGTSGGHADHGQRMTMPGMASDQDLDRLRSLSGVEFDKFFLQLMIRHHQGGAAMAAEAAERATLPPVRNLAQQILRAQRAETETMTRLLVDRGGHLLPAHN